MPGSSSSSDAIEFQINSDFRVYYTVFYLLRVDPNHPDIWMISGGTELCMQTIRPLRST
jgi:hypothetical protein